MLSLLFAILVAENICLGFWLYTRPDRRARQVERESLDFLKTTALKILNRAWGVQGAPPMDDEFDEPEPVVKEEIEESVIRAMDSEQAARVLEEKEAELERIARPRSEGSIAKRRRMISELESLRRQVAAGIPPRVAPGLQSEPYINSLEPADEAHLSQLREN